jgi:hypothetical protein
MMRLAPSCRATRQNLPEEVCLSAACAVGLPLAGKGAQLQGSGNLKVREAERRLEWYRGEPDPAELG